MKTIKEVRLDLKMWGDFWAKQEQGQGYSNKSNTQTIKEACQVGCASQSDLHLFNNRADAIYVPAHIAWIDRDIERLSYQCRTAIRQRYINKAQVRYFTDKKTYLFWVNKAERELL